MEAEPSGVKRRIKDASWDFVLNRWMCGDAISVMKNVWRGCLLDLQVDMWTRQLELQIRS